MASSEATHHRRSATGGCGASVSDDSDDDQSWHSMSESGNVQRKSCESDCPVEEVDLESGVLELKKVMHLSKDERNCRICHLGLEGAVGPTLALGSQLTWGVLARGIWALLISNVLRLGSRSREIRKLNETDHVAHMIEKILWKNKSCSHHLYSPSKLKDIGHYRFRVFVGASSAAFIFVESRGSDVS